MLHTYMYGAGVWRKSRFFRAGSHISLSSLVTRWLQNQEDMMCKVIQNIAEITAVLSGTTIVTHMVNGDYAWSFMVVMAIYVIGWTMSGHDC